jgi:hypothetical protein
VRYVPKSFAEVPAAAFGSAEEAWFWFVRCQQVRREGAQLGDGNAAFARPCDPDDVYCAVISLARQRLLMPSHLRVLGIFGLFGRPPDARRCDEAGAARLWDEALDRLSTVLRGKGILA